MAFCTPQAPHHIVQSRVPSGERRECAGVAAADVAARALEENQVLAEFVGQLFDSQISHGDTVHKHSIKARQTLQGFRPGRRDAASSPLLRCAGSGAWRARQPEGNKIVGKIVLSILAVMGLALTSAAALPASATLRVIAVQTNDIKTYRHEVDTLQSEFKKEGLPVTLRVWRATYAGPDTGTIIVTVEVPDLATLAKIGEAVAKPNSALGATMKRIDALRKIASDSLYEEISP